MVSYFVSSNHRVLITVNILKRHSRSASCACKLGENYSWQRMPVVCTCLVVATPDIQCVHGRDQLQAVLNTVMNLLLPQEVRYFRTSLPVVSFSRRHLELNGKGWKLPHPYTKAARCFCMLPCRISGPATSAPCLFTVTRAYRTARVLNSFHLVELFQIWG